MHSAMQLHFAVSEGAAVGRIAQSGTCLMWCSGVAARLLYVAQQKGRARIAEVGVVRKGASISSLHRNTYPPGGCG
jgi:hypothetical protein